MLETIIENRYTITAVILFTLGFGNLLLHQNPFLHMYLLIS